MNKKQVWGMLTRYILLLILPLGNLWLFYIIFTPLTLYPTAFFLSLLKDAMLIQGTNLINLDNGITIELIPACIAGAAYYLLAILNLTTPMSMVKRAKSLLFLFSSFFILNIVRIVFFALIAGSVYFNIAHKAIWYGGSTFLVVALWFFSVWLFNINKVPILTDFSNLWQASHAHKKKQEKTRIFKIAKALSS